MRRYVERVRAKTNLGRRELAVLQAAKETLQLQRNAEIWISMYVSVVLECVNSLPEGGNDEEGLEDGVHVAGGPLVHQAHFPRASLLSKESPPICGGGNVSGAPDSAGGTSSYAGE